MAFEDYLDSSGHWFAREGPESGVVLASRVRYARNLDGRKFPHHANVVEQAEVVNLTRAALEGAPEALRAEFHRLSEIPSLDRQFLTEHQMLSPEHAASLGERAAALNPHRGISVLVNEEDHLRLQAFTPGLDLSTALKTLRAIDGHLASRLPYARDATFGHLTACPTNLGPALRVGVLVHLPALVASRRAARLFESLAPLGFAVRGLHGESTRIPTPFFQVSNQHSLGKRESEILEQVERVARQIVEREAAARRDLAAQEGLRLRDRVGRTLGVLQRARLLGLEEALEALSLLRLGVLLGWVRNCPLPELYRLLVFLQPAHLMKRAGRELSGEELDAARADFLREAFRGAGEAG